MSQQYLQILSHSLECLAVDGLWGVGGEELTANRPQEESSHGKPAQHHQQVGKVFPSLDDFSSNERFAREMEKMRYL